MENLHLHHILTIWFKTHCGGEQTQNHKNCITIQTCMCLIVHHMIKCWTDNTKLQSICDLFVFFSDTGRLKTSLPSVSALVFSCTPWPQQYVTRSTSTASGPLAGTPTQARICRTTTTTRKGPNSPLSGRKPTSCPASSSCSTSCTGKAWSNSAWRTALRHSMSPGWFKTWLQRPLPNYISSVQTSVVAHMISMISV